jgi:hypothetical protein
VLVPASEIRRHELGLRLPRTVGGVANSELIIDLRDTALNSLDDFWDAVSGPAGLPDWFGRNLDAWWDTIQTRGISEVIDSADVLVVQARPVGLFAPGNRDGERLAGVFADSTHARLEFG